MFMIAPSRFEPNAIIPLPTVGIDVWVGTWMSVGIMGTTEGTGLGTWVGNDVGFTGVADTVGLWDCSVANKVGLAGVHAAKNNIIAKTGIKRFMLINLDYSPNSNQTVIQPPG
jgi:hypothetical protein